jgi:hypothetical protein
VEDPFNILGQEPPEPPTFEQAARDAVTAMEANLERFEALREQLSEEQFTEEEWRIVERTAADVETAVERAEEGYIAVQYDSHAWYRIMEGLNNVNLRLQSAISLMESVRDRTTG